MCYLILQSGGIVQKHFPTKDDALAFARTQTKITYGEWCGEKLPL